MKSAKFERCVRHVKARGGGYNPWAVCHAQLGENPISKMLAWTLGLGAAAVAGVAAIAYASTRKSVPSKPVWSRLTANPSTGEVSLPLNSTFAISIPGDDANVANIAANLNSYAASGLIAGASGTTPGQAAPAGWPADNLGTNAYRYTGAVAGGNGIGVAVDQSTQAWVFAGVST